MGGRLFDWLGAGIAADRPAAVDMPALLVSSGATALYFATDTKIIGFFDESGPSWFDVDIGALATITTESIQDMIAAFLLVGAGLTLTYNDAGNQLTLACSITQYTDEKAQDAIAALIAAGTHVGIGIVYDDALNTLSFTNTVTQYTNEMAMDAIAAMIAAGTHTGVTITYNDVGDAMSFTVTVTQYTDELAQDAIAALIAAGTNTGLTVTYNDAGNAISITITEASSANMWAGTSSAVVVTPKKIFDMAAPVAVAYAATITLDLATGLNFDIGTLTGPLTLANFANAKAGQSGVIHFVQDGTGSRVITYGSNFRAAGGLAVGGLLSIPASSVDELTYFVRTDGKIVVSILKDVKA
jgi:hypothetical protein